MFIKQTTYPRPQESQCVVKSEDLRPNAIPSPDSPHSTGVKSYPRFPKTQRKGECPAPMRNLWHIKEADQPGRGQAASQGSPLTGCPGFLRAKVVWGQGLIL